MDITVAICTWNRCELLRQTLQRLTEVVVPSHASWEVLVIDNNSSDLTRDVAAAFYATLPLRLIFEPQPGTSNARNRALAEARGDYIAWIDDDVLVSTHWLLGLSDATRRHPAVQAFGGPIEPWFPTPPDPVLLAAFPSLANGFCGLDYGTDEMTLRSSQPLYTANMAIARRAVVGLRFNLELGGTGGSGVCGEDVDFLAQIRSRGGMVVWVPQMRVKHYVDPSRMTVAYLRLFAYDRGRSIVRQRAGGDGPRLLGVPRWCWRAIVQHYACYTALRVTPLRRQALVSLRDYQYVRGVIAESLAQRRGGSVTPQTVGAPALESGRLNDSA